MVKAIHTMLFSSDAPATRAFLRDVIGWPYVQMPGSEPAWLIFGCGPSEMGIHPAGEHGGAPSDLPHHEISLMCDDIHATVAELTARGAKFRGGVDDQGWGLVAMIEVPGAGDLMLYQARHPEAYKL